MKRIKQLEKSEEFQESLKIMKEWEYKNEEREKVINEIEYMKSYVLKDVEKIIEILRDGYLDKDDKLTEKGLIAIEVNDCNPIIFTELIYSKYLEECTFEEIVGLLGAFIDEKSRDFHYMGLKELGKEKELTDKIIDLLYYLDDEMGYLEKLKKRKNLKYNKIMIIN